MTDSLAGARLKLLRAREHLEVLGDELAAFTAGEPYRIAHEPNADGSEHIFRTQVLKEPPTLLSVIIGDALQNMRSALEHLVWGLAFKDKGSEPSRSTSFPIYRTEAAFFQTDKNTSSGYSAGSGMHKISEIKRVAVKTAIQQLQPYKTGHDELYILNELARVDRHQSLRTIGGANRTVTQGWRKRGTRGPFVADFDLLRPPGAIVTISSILEHNAKVGHFHFREPEMEVYFHFPRYVAFRDAGPATGMHALRTLTTIRRHIESDVIPKLERFF
jgi:hypothetical protein